MDKSQYLIQNWQKISEILKNDINQKFKSVNRLNPIYMMAFSGARGNISQVRQLIGMRGLMADPNGQIIHLPITSNFREGLTVTEYLISCYGARKGVVDTALRTATAGYLTRRLVDTAQHVIISQLDCMTLKGVFLSNLFQNDTIVTSLKDQLYGRILAADLSCKNRSLLRNQQIDDFLAGFLSKNLRRVYVRSALNCQASNLTICQLCYGWNLSHLRLISLGEVVGVIAAQSIGEPGTQLTMRTFHTGGVFSGSAINHLYAPFKGIVNYSSTLQGTMIHTYDNKILLLVKKKGLIILNPISNIDSNHGKFTFFKDQLTKRKSLSRKFEAVPYTMLFIKNKERVEYNQLIAKKHNTQSTTQQIKGYYYVLSNIEGEVFLNDYSFSQKDKINKFLSLNKKENLWILSGKIYKSFLNLRFFPKVGDFISKAFPLAKIKLLNNYPSFLRSFLIKTNTITSSNFNKQNYQSLLFTDYPLYSFLLNKVTNLDQYSIINPISSQSIENENTIRLHDFNKNKYTFLSCTFLSIKNKRINIDFDKLEQSHYFLKKNNLSEYFERTIKDYDNIYWFPSSYLVKNDIKILNNSKNFPRFISEKFSSTLSSDLNNHSNLFQNDYLSITLDEKNIGAFKKKLNYINIPNVNLLLKTSDLFLLEKVLIRNDFSDICENKTLLFYPKTSLRIFYSNFLIRYLNYQQSNLFFPSTSIVRFLIRSSVLNYSIPISSISDKIKKRSFSKSNFFGNLVENFLFFYVFSSFFDRKMINFFFYYLGKILVYQHSFKAIHEDWMNFISLIYSCYSFLERFGLLFHIKICWKEKELCRFIIQYASSFLISRSKEDFPCLILLYINQFKNQMMTNVISFNQNQSILNYFSSFFYSRKRKTTLSFNNPGQEYSDVFYDIMKTNMNFMKIDVPNIFPISSFLNLKIFDGWILSMNNFKDSNLLVPCIKQTHLESLQIPQFLREFDSIFQKFRFWDYSQLIFASKNFSLCGITSFHSMNNFLDCESINRKNCSFYQIFPNSFYSRDFLKKNDKNSFLKNCLVNIHFSIKIPYYFLIKAVKSMPIFSHANFKNLFLNYRDNISSFLLNERFKEVFFKDHFYMPSSTLYSLESSLFNKRKFSRLSFSNIYNKIKICYFLQTPLLTTNYVYKYSYIEKFQLKHQFFLFKPLKFIDVITKNEFFIPQETTINNKIQLNINFSNPRYFSLFFKFSLINPIFQRIFDNDSLNRNIKDRILFSFHHLRWLSRGSTLANISFLSPYTGEVLFNKFSKYSNSNIVSNQLMILTKDDVNVFSFFRKKSQMSLIQKRNKETGYYINKAHIADLLIDVGALIYSTSLLSPSKKLRQSGQLIGITKQFCILRKGKPLLYPLNGLFYVWNGDFIGLNSPIMTLLYSKLKTGDIVQGIPKIEHFFEARKNLKGVSNGLQTNLYLKLLVIFTRFKKQLSIQRAIKRSIAKIQKIVIDGILRVYCSQGISISRKHFEVIVRQMTSKAKILDGGETGLLQEELVSLYKIEKINTKIYFKRIIYEPIILGITKTSLKTDSFISSASFQETTRVLSQSALEKKIDFLNGLKENVILGRLIPGGTGIISSILTDFYD